MITTERLLVAVQLLRDRTDDPLHATLAAVADWIEYSARVGGYTERGIDLDSARQVAMAVLADIGDTDLVAAR